MSGQIRPENYDEIEAVISLIWDDDAWLPNDRAIVTRIQLREACEKRILEMRGGQGADDVRGRG